MTTTETPVSGAEFYTDYLTFGQDWIKANLKMVISSGVIFALNKVNPYKKKSYDQKYLLTYPIDQDTYEAVFSFVAGYSSAVEDLVVAPVLKTTNLTDASLVAGLRGFYSRMAMELLFNPKPDYMAGVLHFVGNYTGSYLATMLREKLPDANAPITG